MNLKSIYRILFVLIFSVSFLNMTVEIWNTAAEIAEEIDEESDSISEEEVAFFNEQLIEFETCKLTLSLLSESARINEISFKTELISEVQSPPPEYNS